MNSISEYTGHGYEEWKKAQPELSKAGLKERGWTETLIKNFFPVPTREKANPRYKCAAPMKLYDKIKIEEIEKTPEFVTAKKKADARKLTAKAGAKKKLGETLDWANSVYCPEIPGIKNLRQDACDHYNHLWASRGRWEKHANPNDDTTFLNRIIVNFLRHELSPYEEKLFEAKGRTGAPEARAIIRQKVLEAIAKKYPWLEPECKNQDYLIESDIDKNQAA